MTRGAAPGAGASALALKPAAGAATGRWQAERERLAESFARPAPARRRPAPRASAKPSAGWGSGGGRRLQYDQLHGVQQRRTPRRRALSRQQAGEAVLREQVEGRRHLPMWWARWTGHPDAAGLAGRRAPLKLLEARNPVGGGGHRPARGPVRGGEFPIRRARAGMQDPRRPVGFLPLPRPTGSQRPNSAKALAAALLR